MSLFLSQNTQIQASVPEVQNQADQTAAAGLENADFFKCPKGLENRSVQLDYTQL